jgi:hypothetical protein
MKARKVIGANKTFREYWRQARRDLIHNVATGAPLLVFLAVYLVVSSFLLQSFGHLHSLGDSFYSTWATMTTIGNTTDVSNGGGQVTDAVKALIALDGFFGIVLIGTIVWLITQSLQSE